MPDPGGAVDKAKDHPEKIEQAKDKAAEAVDGQQDGDQK